MKREKKIILIQVYCAGLPYQVVLLALVAHVQSTTMVYGVLALQERWHHCSNPQRHPVRQRP